MKYKIGDTLYYVDNSVFKFKVREFNIKRIVLTMWDDGEEAMYCNNTCILNKTEEELMTKEEAEKEAERLKGIYNKELEDGKEALRILKRIKEVL